MFEYWTGNHELRDAFIPIPTGDTDYATCVLYESWKVGDRGKNITDVIKSRKPIAMVDTEDEKKITYLLIGEDCGIPILPGEIYGNLGYNVNDYHGIFFPDKQTAISFVKKNHPEIRYLKRKDTNELQELE